MRPIGLHMRLTPTIFDAARRAADLRTPIFQCFLIQQQTNQFITLTDQEVAQFVKEWRTKFDHLYVHGSYWINLASIHSHNRIITRELELAQRLEFTHMVVHPGSAKNLRHKRDGIAGLARNLNALFKQDLTIQILLENSAHAGLSLGGDLHDFLALRERLDQPEKLQFCIDTAHAYVYGYDITTKEGREAFFELLDATMGLKNIALIHLNDSKQECGSRIDRHEIIGQGRLADALPHFVMTPPLQKVPIIVEAPMMGIDEEKAMIEMIKKWEK